MGSKGVYEDFLNEKKKKKKNVIIHVYVVPTRVGTFACTTLQSEFSVYSGKNHVKKKICKKPEINKQIFKKKHSFSSDHES